jgi:diguanylate cyclase (GGDEF)-like protein
MAALRLPGSLVSGLRRAANSVRGWQIWTLASPLREYIVLVTVLVGVTILLSVARTERNGTQLVIFLALLGCGVVAIESTRTVKEIHGAIVRDLQPVFYLAIAITLPPAYAFVAPVPLVVYKLWRIRGLVVYRRVFSNATISAAYGSISVIFHALPSSVAGHSPGSGAHAVAWCGIVAVCGALAWAINDGLVVIAIKLSDPKARVRELIGNREAITSDLIELSLGTSLALIVAIDPVLMALALPSIVLYRRYLMNSQLLALARIDAKTGLLNANTWQREAEVELFRAMRSRAPLALAMVNIDHFKSMNETVGSIVSDQLRRDIAGMLREQLRDQDLIGRFGGEEFAILLPQTGRDEAKRISERVRDHIAAEPIAIESGSQEGFVFRLTVSIGVAVLNESRRALTELIGAADSALGQARSTGWSKVYVLPDGSAESETS